ncbi:formylglycine-generating enzyme family protein [Xanthomonadaceae bacterium XH05]|nr:formylglycine-generating enzyme family protein [Xanthomonadaceae bacterium XH05]
MLRRFRPCWPVWVALALLAGCGEAGHAPPEEAPAEVVLPMAADGPSAPVSVVAFEPASVRETTPGDAESEDDAAEPAGDSTVALHAHAESLLASGKRMASRRALRILLDARDAGDSEDLTLTLAARAAATLIEWDRLALEHDAPGAATRDLPLLRRWHADDPQVLSLATELDRVQRLVAALEWADRLASAGHLVGPDQDNASAQLHRALQLDPAHAGVQRRLERIETILLQQAFAAAQEEAFDRAETLLADAGRVRADSARVQDMAARVVEVRERHVERWRIQIGDRLAAGDIVGAEALLPSLDAIVLDERDSTAARADIERVRHYGAYDAGMLLADPLASGGLGPGMVVMPVGRFAMGSPRGEAGRQSNEGPRHTVRITRGFALARTETTVAQFRTFVDATGYRTTAQKARRSLVYDERSGALVERRRITWRDDYAGQIAADDAPVLHVSWDDARAYAQWLAQQTGAPYRLPSETEFEYALRAGSTSIYPWGDDIPPPGTENLTGGLDQSPNGRRWSNAFAGYGDGFWGPAPVARFASNVFGVNDLNGNVSEWVEDCWHDSYSRAPRDGSAWVNPGCAQRVVRGASWASSPGQARSAFRIRAAVDTVSARVGFRVARDL